MNVHKFSDLGGSENTKQDKSIFTMSTAKLRNTENKCQKVETVKIVLYWEE